MASDDSDDSDDSRDAMSLRERKRLETRERISWAAAWLAANRGGLTKVRVKEIAEAAGISHRTFHNYFGSREEAIAAIASDRARRVALALRERPADEPLGEALTEAVLREYLHGREPDRDTARQMRAAFDADEHDRIRGEFIKGIAAMEEELTEAIADRTGHDPADLHPRILAAAVAGAVRVATEIWLHGESDTPYSVLLRQAVSIAAGMPTPGDSPR